METFVLVVVSLVLATVVVLGTLEVRRLRRSNRELQEKLTQVEGKISASVEERLVSHTKYCERVDALVKEQLAIEEDKWRELISVETCRMKEVVAEAIRAARKLQESNEAEIKERQEANEAKIKHELEKTMMNFKSLLDQSYLDEYEKMRRNPPKPKKGPRKKIDPPQRYRSLDDEFNFCPPIESAEPSEPAEPSEVPKAKRKKK